MTDNTYTCSVCENTYEKGWSDEEAMKEKNTLWGDAPLEEFSIVCEDCNIAFLEWLKEKEVKC